MKRFMFPFLVFVLVFSTASSQNFHRTFGGKSDEHALTVLQARDGDYYTAGFTRSFGAGKSDIWVMKIGRRGQEKWRAYLGEEDFDWPSEMIECEDGGVVVAGHTKNPENLQKNAWVFKLDSKGNTIWSYTFGGEKTDDAKAIIQTRDGGFAVAGFSHSFSRGKSDIWLLRLSAEGQELWSKNYGGKNSEQANSLVEMENGDLVLGGYTESYGNGRADILVMRVTADGRPVWRRNYGGTSNESAEAIVATQDGSLVLAGWTGSEGNGNLDGTLLKLDGDGVYQWQRTYGDMKKDVFYDMIASAGGGYIMTGVITAYDGEDSNLWTLKVSSMGEVEWERTSLGTGDEYGHSITDTHDGGYLIAGGTKSMGKGGSDMWLIKTDDRGLTEAGAFGTPITFAQASEEPPAKDNPVPNPSNAYKPNLYILTIGISDYRDPAVNLSYAHTDAESVSEKFRDMEGKLYNRVKIRKLVNDQATLVNIKTGISWLEQEATQKDVIMIFISSHGALDHKGNLYILPTDFDAYNLFATALNIRDLTEGINAVTCKKLIMLDACHSGQSGFDMLEFASLKNANLDQLVKELIDKEPGVTVMTSSSGKEYSYETAAWRHGAFSKAILEGLDGAADINRDRVVSLNEMDLFVSERVKELTQGRQHPYTPINLFGNIPLFVLD